MQAAEQAASAMRAAHGTWLLQFCGNLAPHLCPSIASQQIEGQPEPGVLPSPAAQRIAQPEGQHIYLIS